MDRNRSLATPSASEKRSAAAIGPMGRSGERPVLEHELSGQGASPYARFACWGASFSSAAEDDVLPGSEKEAAGTGQPGAMLFKARPGGAHEADPASVRAQLGKGQSLPGTVRSRMASAFGTGFGGVRLHVDAKAARLSNRLNARAFTVGRDVAFAAGEYRPGTPTGDALIAHELAHVLQQGGASGRIGAPVGGETAELERSADRSAMSAVAGFFGATFGGSKGGARNERPAGGAGLRLQRCKSAKENAHDAEVGRLGGKQYEFLEQQRVAEQEKQRKAAEEAAKKSGLPPPTSAPKVSVDDIIKKETKAADPPAPAGAWTSLKPEAQRKWEQDAKDAWKKVVASVAGTELENVVKGKKIDFRPKEALEQSYFGAQLGNSLLVGMEWVRLANADPKNVWPNIAHELGGHFEYGPAYATEIMMNTLEKLPEAERKKWKTDPALRQKFFMVYEYAETEIFAELRERRYSKPETGKAPPNPTDQPDSDVPFQLGELKRNLHPEVAKAVVAELKRRVDASSTILERDKKFFAEQIKLVFGSAP